MIISHLSHPVRMATHAVAVSVGNAIGVPIRQRLVHRLACRALAAGMAFCQLGSRGHEGGAVREAVGVSAVCMSAVGRGRLRRASAEQAPALLALQVARRKSSSACVSAMAGHTPSTASPMQLAQWHVGDLIKAGTACCTLSTLGISAHRLCWHAY